MATEDELEAAEAAYKAAVNEYQAAQRKLRPLRTKRDKLLLKLKAEKREMVGAAKGETPRERRHRALALRHAGASFPEIGRVLNVSATRAQELVRRAQWDLERQEELHRFLDDAWAKVQQSA